MLGLIFGIVLLLVLFIYINWYVCNISSCGIFGQDVTLLFLLIQCSACFFVFVYTIHRYIWLLKQ